MLMHERSPSDLITLVHENKQFNNVNTQTAARMVIALMHECANKQFNDANAGGGDAAITHRIG